MKHAMLSYGQDLLIVKKTDLKTGLIFDSQKALVDDSVLKPNRQQICGKNGFNMEVIEKVRQIIAKNKSKTRSKTQLDALP